MNDQFRSCSYIIDVEHRKDRQLDSKRKQIRRHCYQRHDDTREIDLSEDVCIRHKRVRRGVKTRSEITPNGDAQQIEKNSRHSVRRDIGYASENGDIDEHGEHRRNDEPKRSKNGLFVCSAEIALHKEHEHIAISPYFAPIDSQ